MKALHRTAIALGFILAILFLIAGMDAAGYVSPEQQAVDIGLKQVPYNINGIFTTVSGIAYNSSSGEYDTNNPQTIYTVTQYDRLFTIVEDGSSAPLFFAIDDKNGRHFFSHRKNGNTTLFQSGIIESDDVFSKRTIISSGGIVRVQTNLAVRNGAEVSEDSTPAPDLIGTWSTAQNSVYEINSQKETCFPVKSPHTGKQHPHGLPATSTLLPRTVQPSLLCSVKKETSSWAMSTKARIT